MSWELIFMKHKMKHLSYKFKYTWFSVCVYWDFLSIQRLYPNTQSTETFHFMHFIVEFSFMDNCIFLTDGCICLIEFWSIILTRLFVILVSFATWKRSEFGFFIFFGLYFPVCGLNTVIYRLKQVLLFVGGL